jgi:hypothetical protein
MQAFVWLVCYGGVTGPQQKKTKKQKKKQTKHPIFVPPHLAIRPFHARPDRVASPQTEKLKPEKIHKKIGHVHKSQRQGCNRHERLNVY